MIVANNIITTIMRIKGKVNTGMKLTEDCIICYLYTRIKKHMTKKCITFIIVKTGKRL